MSVVDKKNEILWVNTLKGICILLVVLHHSIITTLAPSIDYLSSGVLPANLWVAFNKILSPLRMPAFFFVSGLLSIRAMQDKSWSETFTKKVGNLLYLYILWGVIQWFLISGIISTAMESKLSDAENSAYAETLLDFLSLLFFAKTSLWYLYALAGYFFVAKTFKNFKYILLITAVFLNYFSTLGFIDGWGIISISQNMIYFLLGAFFSDFLLKATEITKNNLLIWLSLIILAAINIKLGFGKNIFACTCAIISSIMICRVINKSFNVSWLNWIGKNTLQIYVIHRILIEFIGISSLYLGVEFELFKNNAFSLLWGVFFPLMDVIICTVFSIFIWRILNKNVGKYLFSHPKLVKK